MTDIIERLVLANLLEVFNERDITARLAAIERTYSHGVRWTDSEGSVTGHHALNAKCVGLQTMLGNQQFVAGGPIHALDGFGQMAWQLIDPSTGRFVMSGFDTVLVKDDLITDLWTVVLPPPQ